MSEREQVLEIIDAMPEYRLAGLLAFLRAFTEIPNADEADDDAFCQKMYEDYLNDPERGDFVPFADVLKECGVTLDEL